jgi:hypothetical protein
LTAWAEFDELLHQRSRTLKADALSELIERALHTMMANDVVVSALNELERLRRQIVSPGRNALQLLLSNVDIQWAEWAVRAIPLSARRIPPSLALQGRRR